MKRNNIQFLSAIVIAAAIGIFYQNCAMPGGGMSPRAVGVSVEKLQELNGEIDALVARDLSCNSVSDCVAVPVGSRACGGPQRYVVASRLNTEFAAIEAKAKQASDAEAAFNQSSGAMSICSVVVEPGLACTGAKCGVAP